MDKLEYILGDLVYFGGSIAKVEFQNPNADDSIWVKAIENGDENRVWNASLKDEIWAIPLTPKILEKNGWKKDGKWYSLKTRRAYLYTIQDAGQPDEFLICANTDKHNLTSVSFVHQLQHLLFGLGLNSEMEV